MPLLFFVLRPFIILPRVPPIGCASILRQMDRGLFKHLQNGSFCRELELAGTGEAGGSLNWPVNCPQSKAALEQRFCRRPPMPRLRARQRGRRSRGTILSEKL